MNVKFPEITVELTGRDGNAFAILGTVIKALKRAGVPADAIDEFSSKAKSGDYDNLLATVLATVTVI